MKKLKLKLWRTNKTVHMQILEQEGITESLSEHIKIDNGGWQMFTEKSIYLRSEKIYDDYIVNIQFISERLAKNYINNVVLWLNEAFTRLFEHSGDHILSTFNISTWGLIPPVTNPNLIKSGYNPETHIYYGEID